MKVISREHVACIADIKTWQISEFNSFYMLTFRINIIRWDLFSCADLVVVPSPVPSDLHFFSFGWLYQPHVDLPWLFLSGEETFLWHNIFVMGSILFRGGKVFISMFTNGNKQAVGGIDASL